MVGEIATFPVRRIPTVTSSRAMNPNNNNLLLTEREGRTGEYWPEVVAVRTERSEVRTKTTEGQYSPVRSRASEVSKWFIIWHHFSYETTLPVVHSSQFPARCQGKKPAILTVRLSNQFDDRCCRSAEICVALE